MELKVKTRINATDRSQLTGQKVSEVIQEKLDYIIDRVLNEPPHILWVTKNAFMWGGGKVFNNLDEGNPLRSGFITTFGNKGHLAIKRPTNKELQFMELKYGIALDFPPPSLFALIQAGFRKIERNLMKDKNMKMIPCHGYINEEGKLVQPGWNISEDLNGNMISGYFIFCVDSRIEEVKKQLIDESDIRFQLQFERAKYTSNQIENSRIKVGETTFMRASKKLMSMSPILEQLKTNHPVNNWNLLLDKKASELE
jgi:hypothetical protein